MRTPCFPVCTIVDGVLCLTGRYIGRSGISTGSVVLLEDGEGFLSSDFLLCGTTGGRGGVDRGRVPKPSTPMLLFSRWRSAELERALPENMYDRGTIVIFGRCNVQKSDVGEGDGCCRKGRRNQIRKRSLVHRMSCEGFLRCEGSL